MFIFEILINNKKYASVQTRIEAETIQELLYNYLEVENIEYIKIMEVKSMSEIELEEYKAFIYNIDNAYKCGNCPENRYEKTHSNALPCGQFHCWVKLSAPEKEDKKE